MLSAKVGCSAAMPTARNRSRFRGVAFLLERMGGPSAVPLESARDMISGEMKVLSMSHIEQENLEELGFDLFSIFFSRGAGEF